MPKINLDSLFVVTGKCRRPIHPVDENPGNEDQGMMVYFSREAAEKAAEYQNDMYELDAIACPLADVVPEEFRTVA
jgi:hypothetical protein